MTKTHRGTQSQPHTATTSSTATTPPHTHTPSSTSSATQTSTQTPTNTSLPSSSGSGPNIGTIVGLSVGIPLLLAAIGLGFFWWTRLKRRKAALAAKPFHSSNGTSPNMSISQPVYNDSSTLGTENPMAQMSGALRQSYLEGAQPTAYSTLGAGTEQSGRGPGLGHQDAAGSGVGAADAGQYRASASQYGGSPTSQYTQASPGPHDEFTTDPYSRAERGFSNDGIAQHSEMQRRASRDAGAANMPPPPPPPRPPKIAHSPEDNQLFLWQRENHQEHSSGPSPLSSREESRESRPQERSETKRFSFEPIHTEVQQGLAEETPDVRVTPASPASPGPLELEANELDVGSTGGKRYDCDDADADSLYD